MKKTIHELALLLSNWCSVQYCPLSENMASFANIHECPFRKQKASCIIPSNKWEDILRQDKELNKKVRRFYHRSVDPIRRARKKPS